MKSVFIVFHEREIESGGDDTKMIGAYSSKVKGEAAIARLRDQPGFCDYPDGFSIDEYTLDQDHWLEGFGGPDPD
jgi:hypothetical protein